MSDIEGAICDECGSRVGPNGCCADARSLRAALAESQRRERELREALRAALDHWGDGPPTMKSTADWANLWAPRLLAAIASASAPQEKP